MSKLTTTYPIRFDGSDADYLYFSTRSWSDRKVRYDISVDKRTGTMRCGCMDAMCRRKEPDLVKFLRRDPGERHCKHLGLLRETFGELLNMNEDDK